MTALAQAKGWSAITASGHPDFRREVWMEARLRGIGVLGYEPSEQDQEGLASRLERTMRHVATRGKRRRAPPCRRGIPNAVAPRRSAMSSRRLQQPSWRADFRTQPSWSAS